MMCRLRIKTGVYNCLVMCLSFFLFSCSGHDDVSMLLATASDQISNKNYSAAVITLKNVIQIEKENGKAREQLANVYLALGNYPAAEKEYRRAFQYEGINSNIILGLGSSLNTQGKYKQTLSEKTFNIANTKSSKINVLLVKGDANYGLGRFAAAETAYMNALKLDPNSIIALTGMARVAISDGRYIEANAYIRDAENIDNEDQGLWLAKGILSYQEGNIIAAEESFLKIIGLSNQDSVTYVEFRAYIGLITLHLKKNQTEKADKKIQVLLKKAPNNLLPIYYSAIVDYQKKNYSEAQKKLRVVVEKLPEYMSATFLLGATNYALGNYEQADALLTKFVYEIPNHIPARKILTVTRLKLNRPKYALDAVSPAIAKDDKDIQLLMMAGMAATSMGDASTGIKYYKRAGKLSSDNKYIREELAKIYLAEGDIDKAIDELKLNITDSDSIRTLVLLARAHLKKGESKQARNYIQQAINAKKDSPNLYTLLGVTELIGGNKDLAIAAFRNAVNVSEDFIPAYYYLAQLEFENGSRAKAEEYFAHILELQPGNLNAMFGMAHISESRNDIDQAVEWLKKAIKSNPGKSKPYLVLGYYYIKTKQTDEALKLVEDLKKLPAAPDVSLYIARVYLLVGQYEKSISVLKKIKFDEKKDLEVRSELAKLYLKMGDYISAKKEINKAIDLEPTNIKPYLLLAMIETNSGNIDNALKVANKIELLFPNFSLVNEIYGDIYLSNKFFSKAVNHYQKSIASNPGVTRYIKLANSYAKDKNIKHAIATLTKANELYPNEKRILFAQGNLYQLNNKPHRAIELYEKIINTSPNDTTVLNNLAYAYIDINNKKSLKYAHQAYKIAPTNVAIIDTLAWVLINTGKNKEAVGYLDKLYNSTDIPSIHYHYAVGLYNLEKYEEAKKILSKLIQSKQVFMEQDAARALLKKVEGKQ